jgi:DNA primase
MTAATIFFASQYPADYLQSRGIDERIGGNYLIGANCNDKINKKILREHLERQGFSLETIRLAGLLDSYDQDYFRDHIIIPYRQYGQVYEFVGRYVGDDQRYQDSKYFRMRGAEKGRLIVGRGYFN